MLPGNRVQDHSPQSTDFANTYSVYALIIIDIYDFKFPNSRLGCNLSKFYR